MLINVKYMMENDGFLKWCIVHWQYYCKSVNFQKHFHGIFHKNLLLFIFGGSFKLKKFLNKRIDLL